MFSGAIKNWIVSGLPKDGQEAYLHRKRVYILPTRRGYIFFVMLIAMLMGSLNYGASLAFMMTFWLAAIALVTMIHTYRNLLGITLRFDGPDDVFAGESASFPITFKSIGSQSRFALQLTTDNHQTSPIDVINNWAHSNVLVPTTQRGKVSLDQVKVETVFPLGIFSAWTWVQPKIEAYVYPKPSDKQQAHTQGHQATGNLRKRWVDDEEFYGFREFQPGDDRRHIAWRQSARAHRLLIPEHRSQTRDHLVFDYLALSGPTEERLSQLALCIVNAHAEGLHYTLRLPRQTELTGTGSSHKRQCLRALASFGQV